jgi:tight adherence protein C
MGYAVLTFLVCFLLVGSGLLLMFYREMLGKRLSSVLSPDRKTEVPGVRLAESLGNFAGRLRKLSLKTGKDNSVAQKRLSLAGYREDWHVNLFSAAMFICPALLLAVVFVTGLYDYNAFLAIIGALGLGYLAPDYWLGHRIKARQNSIRAALPDVMDLLVVCLEAGLSLDQAVLRTTDEMRSNEEMQSVHRVMADELSLVMLDVRGGRSRKEAWKNLAERTDVDTVRILVAVLVQADQFGTGISKTLRIQADTMRTRRRQHAEEMAAKTTVKLVFPLVLFIFPSLYIVTLGPAVILFMEGFSN